MSTTLRHPHADIIKAWLDGEVIEVLQSQNKWVQYVTESTTNWLPQFSVKDKFRIKPKMKKVYYRNALFHSEDFPEPWVSACYNKSLESSLERGDSFVRWLGDWQSVEVEDA